MNRVRISSSTLIAGLLVANVLTLSACSKGSSSATSTAVAAADSSPASELAGGACSNPISMKVQPGEQQMELDQVVDGTDGQYVLVATKLFTRTDSPTESNFLSGVGSAPAQIPNDLRKTETSDLTKVVCHTSRPGVNDVGSKHTDLPDGFKNESWKNTSTNSMNGSLDVPVTISTKDGRVTLYREDTFHVKDGVPDSKTVFHPQNAQIKPDDTPAPPGLTLTTVRTANRDVVLRMRMIKKDGSSTMNLWFEATYQRK